MASPTFYTVLFSNATLALTSRSPGARLSIRLAPPVAPPVAPRDLEAPRDRDVRFDARPVMDRFCLSLMVPMVNLW